MSKTVDVAQAGLQGWRAKVADTVAEPISKRTPADPDQVRAAVGALFFVLAVTYVAKTAKTAAGRLLVTS